LKRGQIEITGRGNGADQLRRKPGDTGEWCHGGRLFMWNGKAGAKWG